MDSQAFIRPVQPGSDTTGACIGEWAAEVRDILRKGGGGMSLADVARRVHTATTNEVAMAIGWLAHAGEVRFVRQGNGRGIALRGGAEAGA